MRLSSQNVMPLRKCPALWLRIKTDFSHEMADILLTKASYAALSTACLLHAERKRSPVRRTRILVTIIALLVCVAIPGIMMLFQPKTLKVTTGTPLTPVGEYESPDGATFSVTPNHRLVGAAKLPDIFYMNLRLD